MCEPVTLIAAGTAVVGMAATASQQSAAAKNANKVARSQNDAALKQSNADYRQQEATMRYQDETWQQDLDFATQTLTYQGKEFDKQAAYVNDAGKAVLNNTASKMAQTALQTVQKNIAITLGEADMDAQAAQARATAQASADSRGAAGNSVDAIIDDVSRQQGQAMGTMEMNRSAINNQARIDLQSEKAEQDSQLGQLQASVKIYSPSQQIRAPGPVGGVQSPSLVSTPERSGLGDALAIGSAGVSGAMTGLSVYSDLTGISKKDAIQSIGKTLSIS